MAVLSMFHVYCMTLCLNSPIASGATIVIMPKSIVFIAEMLKNNSGKILRRVLKENAIGS